MPFDLGFLRFVLNATLDEANREFSFKASRGLEVYIAFDSFTSILGLFFVSSDPKTLSIQAASFVLNAEVQ